MINNSPLNPLDLKDVILTRLGAPVINVEVTEDQIMECISRALELFGEYHPDGTNRGFITVAVTEEILASKTIKFNYPVAAVESILRSNREYFRMDAGSGVLSWFSDYVNALANGHGQSMISGGSVYGGMDSGLQDYYMTMQHLNLMYDMLTPLYNFWYNGTTNTIQVNGEYILGELLVFKIWTPITTSVSCGTIAASGSPNAIAGNTELPTDGSNWFQPSVDWKNAYAGTPYAEQNVYNNRWVKDISTAYVKQLNGIILKKNRGMVLPGGIEVDGQTMYDEATQEIEILRQELRDNEEPLGVIYG